MKTNDITAGTDQVDEIYRLGQGAFNPNKSRMRQYYRDDDAPLPRKKIPGSTFTYSILSASDLLVDSDKAILLWSPTEAEPVGFLGLHYFSSKVKSYQVSVIAVDPAIRGQGLAMALYGIVLGIMKATLVSGFEQTPGGRLMWTKLASVPNNKVFGVRDLGAGHTFKWITQDPDSLSDWLETGEVSAFPPKMISLLRKLSKQAVKGVASRAEFRMQARAAFSSFQIEEYDRNSRYVTFPVTVNSAGTELSSPVKVYGNAAGDASLLVAKFG